MFAEGESIGTTGNRIQQPNVARRLVYHLECLTQTNPEQVLDGRHAHIEEEFLCPEGYNGLNPTAASNCGGPINLNIPCRILKPKRRANILP